jgi:hypothetical protein
MRKKKPCGIHLGSQGFEREEQTKHELVVLLSVKSVKWAIPFSIKQTNAVPVKDIHHVCIVP